MEKTDRPLLAIALRIAAISLIATMFMIVKYAGGKGISAPEIIFWRQAVSLPLLLAWMAATGKLVLLRTSRTASHARRAATGMTALFCNVIAAIYLPLAEATTLTFTTPLFAVILTATVMREFVGPWRWTSVLLGFAGVLIIAQPGHGAFSIVGTAAGLAAGLLIAIVSFQIRDLARTEPSITCVFWFAFFGTAFASILLPVYMTAHTASEWGLLAAIGIVGTLGQILVTASLRYGSVATVLVMDYTALIWSTLYGWMIWDRLPPIATWVGAPVIIAAGMIITWREHLLGRMNTRQSEA